MMKEIKTKGVVLLKTPTKIIKSEIELETLVHEADHNDLARSKQNKQEIQLQLLQEGDCQSTSSSSSAESIEDATLTTPLTPTNERKREGGGHSYPQGTASSQQVAVNIFISFVGSGMLGMPFAFSQSGWLLGILALSVTSTANVYAMLLLVKTRRKLEDDYGYDDISGYGDVGRAVSGVCGESLVNACLVLSQVGFGTAYLIFVAANLYNIAQIDRALTCFGCVPILAFLVQYQDMKKLSPFSLFADVSIIVGLIAVLFQDYQNYQYRTGGDLTAFNFSHLMYVTGVAIYSLEGVGLVLPLESSCADRDNFPSILKKCIFGITTLMIVFGCSGYYAFGPDTETPITLNLVGEWAIVVKLCLCIGLYLTYPMMLFPVNEVMENFFLSDKLSRPNCIFRTTVVIFSAILAYSVPNFGEFLSLVGSSICTILGFILPCYFHLMAFGRKELTYWEIFLDCFLIGFGSLFGVVGTYQSLMGIFGHSDASDVDGSPGSRMLNSILNL